MPDRKCRTSQNNRLLKEIIERLRDYDLEEVAIIRDKFLKRRNPGVFRDDLDGKQSPPATRKKKQAARPEAEPPARNTRRIARS